VILPCFPYKPTVGIVQREKSRFFPAGSGKNPSTGGKNPPPKKTIELETVVRTDAGVKYGLSSQRS
jgi:hypothetical protein